MTAKKTENQPVTSYIERLISQALKRIALLRVGTEGYLDQEEADSRYFLPTLEGLECFLVVGVSHPKLFSVQRLFDKSEECMNAWTEDIKFVTDSSSNPRRRDQQGSPYFRSGLGAHRRFCWLIECSSFAISALSILLKLNRDGQLDLAPREKKAITSALQRHVKWVVGCHLPEGGWSWGEWDQTSQIWPTWSVYESLGDYLKFAGKHAELQPLLRKHRDEAYAWMVAELRKTWGSVAWKWIHSVEQERNIQDPKLLQIEYEFIQVLTVTFLRRNVGDEELAMAGRFFKHFEGVTYGEIGHETFIPGKERVSAQDSSLSTLILRFLSIAIESMGRSRLRSFEKVHSVSASGVLEVAFNRAMENYLPATQTTKYAGLWGYGGKYEVYFTERMLEALDELLHCLEKHRLQLNVHMPPLPEDSNQASEVLGKVKRQIGRALRS
jgi:hypothetical protein